jgi:hypothetical protein
MSDAKRYKSVVDELYNRLAFSCDSNRDDMIRGARLLLHRVDPNDQDDYLASRLFKNVVARWAEDPDDASRQIRRVFMQDCVEGIQADLTAGRQMAGVNRLLQANAATMHTAVERRMPGSLGYRAQPQHYRHERSDVFDTKVDEAITEWTFAHSKYAEQGSYLIQLADDKTLWKTYVPYHDVDGTFHIEGTRRWQHYWAEVERCAREQKAPPEAPRPPISIEPFRSRMADTRKETECTCCCPSSAAGSHLLRHLRLRSLRPVWGYVAVCVGV